MKRVSLFLTLFVLCAPAVAQQYAVAELSATGSKRFAEQEILRATGLEKGKREIPLAQVKDAAGKLLGLGAFKEVTYKHSAVPGGLKVEFAVVDADQFVRADFDNIVWLSQAELAKELHARVPLFSGELPLGTSGGLPEDVAAALQGLLTERGVKGTVSYTMAAASGEGPLEAYVYAVDGVAVKIGQINLAGTSPAISPLLEAASRPLLNTAFHRAQVKDFVAHSLVPVYRRRGYLRAEFGVPQVTVLAHKDAETSVTLTLPVQEGRAYTFAGLRWSGNQVRPTSELEAAVNLRAGEIADGVRLEADLDQVRGRYAQLGYVKAKLDVKPMYDEAAGTVRYEATVAEGEQYTMGKLDIAGLQPSSAEKVRQRWRMREGDAFDPGYVSKFFTDFRLPRGFAYKVELSDGEAANSLDLTLIFCREDTKCLASAPNALTLEDDERRR